MTARSTWKNWERRVGVALGGRRIPVTGIDRHGADVEAGIFNYQLKLRKSLPAWIFDWLGGICGTSPAGKVGVLVLRTPRMRDEDALVIVRFKDWVSLHGSPGKRGSHE
jgi:hypothetical protein